MLLVLPSCRSGRIDLDRKMVSNDNGQALSRDSAQLAYRLSGETWCSNDDACSMMLLLIDGTDHCEKFAQRLILLDVKGVADASWDITPDEPVTKGTLAYMLCRTLGLNNSIMMKLQPSRRYAYREAVYYGLMDRGSENEPVTGPECVGIMHRAAKMLEK